eukprot:scaffold509352_cov31-Prasinocladus_malaysianus.AAC.1
MDEASSLGHEPWISWPQEQMRRPHEFQRCLSTLTSKVASLSSEQTTPVPQHKLAKIRTSA